MVRFEIKTGQQAHIRATFKGAGGRPAKVDPNNPVRWPLLDGDMVADVVSADGTEVKLKSSDLAGTSHFRMEADKQLGDGETLLTEEIEIVVTDELAETVDLSNAVIEDRD